MDILPIYDNLLLFVTGVTIAAIIVGPPLVAAMIAAEKGRSITIWVLLYGFYSFTVPQLIFTFIDITLSGFFKYLALTLLFVPVISAPLFHALRLRRTPSLEEAARVRGVELKMCIYCGVQMVADKNVCDTCHYRTNLSLLNDKNAVILLAATMTFIAAVFAASDEIIGHTAAYNVLEPFKQFSQAFLFAVATASPTLAIICAFQFAAISCIFYCVASVSIALRNLTRGAPTGSPVYYFYAAFYVTILHPALFQPDPLHGDEASAWPLSLGWFLWMLSHGLFALSMRKPHHSAGNNPQGIK